MLLQIAYHLALNERAPHPLKEIEHATITAEKDWSEDLIVLIM